MNLRLKTDINTESKIIELQSLMQLSSKASVIRLAIAFSIKMPGDPRIIGDNIEKYNIRNQNGSDYNRFTIYGIDEIIYKVLMQQQLGYFIEDDEFFPEMTNAHLNRGIKELYAEYKLSKNKEKFFSQFI